MKNDMICSMILTRIHTSLSELSPPAKANLNDQWQCTGEVISELVSQQWTGHTSPVPKAKHPFGWQRGVHS
jgi:hypothetical protein